MDSSLRFVVPEPAGHEVGLLAVDQSVGATMPDAPLALSESEELDHDDHM